MPPLDIQLVELHLPVDTLDAIVAELTEGGMTYGTFSIGSVRKAPDMAYILWHTPGDVPVTMLVSHASFANEHEARACALDFVLHWNQRLG